jgi:very-short-patch-repair endonuclease
LIGSREKEYISKRKDMMIINDNEKTVTCRICGENSSRIYGKHLKFKHNMKSEEYKKLFPDAPLSSKSDLKNTTKNSGKHMKQENHRKMFSEMFSGENNPNHTSRTTEEERKSRSPFSKKFIKYENIENLEEHISNFAKKALKNRIGSTTIEYFIQKGLSEEDARIKLKERQTTFSLEKCIVKYGESEGILKWTQRQEKWLKNYKRINYSKISQELFINLFLNLKESGFNEKVYFARLNPEGILHETDKNYEFRLKLNKSFIVPDFFIPNMNLIIEFDGTYYHRNTPENKKREDIRDMNIIESGYEVIHVLESVYIKNKNKVITELSNIILEKTKSSKNV